MNKKIKIIIIGLIVIAIVGTMYAYISKKEQANTAGENFSLKDLFPFGNTRKQTPVVDEPVISPADGEQAGEEITETPTTNSNLILLYDQPVAGSGITNTNTVRFAEKATAHILEWSPETKTATKIANTTIPKIEDALFDAAGTKVILRYYDEKTNQINTYSAAIQGNALVGNFFPYNISDMVASPDKSRVFYLYPANSMTVGTTANFDGSSKKQVFISKFSSWLAGWANPQTVTATTKASASFPGYLYQIKSTNSQFDKVLGGVSGMIALMSPDGSKVLVSDSSMTLVIYDITNGSRRDTGLKTLAEKCAWAADSVNFYCGVPTYAPNATLPDDWYKGKVQFADELWRENTASHVSNRVAFPGDLGYALDMSKLQLAPNKSFISFIDKTTLQLWVVIL